MRHPVAAVSFETASAKTAAADAYRARSASSHVFWSPDATTDVATAAASGDTQPPLER